MFISSNETRINQKAIQEIKTEVKRITEGTDSNLRKKAAKKIKSKVSKTEES